MNNIRNSVKAVIIKNNKVLLIKCKDHLGIFYLLPGGGQEKGETFLETLHREAKEEIGTDVIIHDIVLIREYIGKNHEFKEFEFDKNLHQIEYMFSCEVPENYTPTIGTHPDSMQQGTEWIELKAINNYRIYPSKLKEELKNLDKKKRKIYLGDVN